MFSIARDSWTQADESSRPELQRLWSTNASGLSHQVTQSSSHSFNGTCSAWQIELGMFAIRSEMIDAPEKLADDHAHDAQSGRLPYEFAQLIENRFQIGTVGKLECFSSLLVKLLAQGSVGQPAVSPASAVLQTADQMEMTELNDPALAGAELDDARNLVGDRCLNALVNVSWNGRNCLRPAAHVLPSWQEQGVEENGAIFLAALDGHQVQHPVFFSKPKVDPIQEQDQRTIGQTQCSRLRYEPHQHATEMATEALRGKAIISCESFQRAAFEHNRFHDGSRQSPGLWSSFFLADTPRTFALAALTASRSKAVNLRSATRRFRVRRIHARELATDWDSNHSKTQWNSV